MAKNQTKIKNRKGGQVMITSAIFLILLSGMVLGGMAAPAISTVKNSNNAINSLESYLAAESGMEDVLYRLKEGMEVDDDEDLTLNGSTVTTETTTSGGTKEVVTTSDYRDYIRKVAASVVAGTGASFNYGIQTGNGGFQMAPQAVVLGNVYSNGNISGGTVTGTAIAANSAAISANQSNGLDGNGGTVTPVNFIQFGKTNAAQDAGQSFTVTEEVPLTKVQLYLRKVNSPGNLTVRILTDNNISPGTGATTLASATLNASLVTSSFGWAEATFTTNPTLVEGTTYWLVLDGTDSSTKYYEWAANQTYGSGLGKTGVVGGAWYDTLPVGLDAYFKIYLGGLTATINDTKVGSAGGDAWAHTVTNSTVSDNLYCQTGSGNNKACNTSRADPTPQAMPISDANIAEFKAQAEAGTLYGGNYVATEPTLGPAKITGDLDIGSDCPSRPDTCLTLTGTVWVQGNLNISSNNKLTVLDSSYGHNGGVIVVDGYVTLSNGSHFCGSSGYNANENECNAPNGSYVMLLSTSLCDGTSCGGNYAIDVPNNAGTVILNAQKGTLHFKNNSGASAATAYRIVMDNGAIVDYETGLTDTNFTSGPSGGWQLDSWQEVE